MNLPNLGIPETNLEKISFVDEFLPYPNPELGFFESGVFNVGASGEVAIDFLFNGGALQEELAIFSLDGMEALELYSWLC